MTALYVKPRFADRLLAAGMITQSQLDLAGREMKRKGGQLGPTLVQLGFLTGEELSGFLAQEAETRTVNLRRTSIEQAIVDLVPAGLARRFHSMPLSRVDNTLTVALADPFNVVAIDTLNQVTGLQIDVVTAPDLDIMHCLDLYYRSGDTIEESIDKILEEKAAEEMAKPLEEVLARRGDTDDDAPVIRLVSQIITGAVNGGASDIHFEPEEGLLRIRTRVDGVLGPSSLIPKAMQSAVTTRMKIVADLNVAETRLPQDGRATVSIGGRHVNLRVSSLPTAFGENIVARILDPSSQSVTVTSLGFEPDVEQQFREAIDKPYGVVLVTGPTGSGKSTTLYAVLREVSTMEVSTFTLEDPIEFRMPLVRQTQIQEEFGLTFSVGLRALLRQDPDIILVGETRDTETAQLMVRAALTGHLVFSTLHTNDAPGAIPRLIDMGVEPYLLPASLVAVLAQRLVRAVCPKCRVPLEDPRKVFEELKLEPPAGVELQMARGLGCPACKQSGYRGRRGIFELMTVDDRFHDAIVHRGGAPEYLRLAREGGMKSMFEDGVLKVSRGITTMEELLRTTRSGH